MQMLTSQRLRWFSRFSTFSPVVALDGSRAWAAAAAAWAAAAAVVFPEAAMLSIRSRRSCRRLLSARTPSSATVPRLACLSTRRTRGISRSSVCCGKFSFRPPPRWRSLSLSRERVAPFPARPWSGRILAFSGSLGGSRRGDGAGESVSLSHSLGHTLLAHLLTHSFTHSLTHSLTQSLTHSLTHCKP